MAKAEEILTQSILELLAQKPQGLEVEEIIQHLEAGDRVVSPRGVRNLLNRLVKERQLEKRKRQGRGRGSPPYAYYHPDTLPRQLSIFDDIREIEKYNLQTKPDVERDDLDSDERERQAQARSVLERIAASHLHEETYARAIVDIAPQLAEENPIDLLINMAQWVVDDMNRRGEEIQRKFENGEFEEARQKAGQLDYQLGWARRYFQLFWRLDRSIANLPGILDLPLRFTHFNKGKRALLNKEQARKILEKRIIGTKVIEAWDKKVKPHKGVTGTDASVADIFLTHSPGSFIPPHPIVVTTSASALIIRVNDSTQEYQTFDISPDELRHYEDLDAAKNGLVLAPELMQTIGTDRFKHSRMAAMELRQYRAELNIPTGTAKWRPLGDARELGIKTEPTLIIRDGRVFPLVHRLGDYEDDTLYGEIVRNQIKQFVNVLHNTIFSPIGEIIYGAAVKSPQMSWLSPLVFWYLHIHKFKVDGRVVVEADEVYKSPFADTAVSHLLFLGVAKHSRNFLTKRLFTTCRVLRRFSDIALVDSSLPVALYSEEGHPKVLNENNPEDWEYFVNQHINDKLEKHQEIFLDESDYKPFLYLCSRIGVFTCYSAPASAYEPIVSDRGGAGHFLIPRLEVAVDLHQPDSYQRNLDKMLSWLADGNWVLDHAHTQSGFDTGEQQHSLPILVPNVTLLAHEAATFARNTLGDEVHDEIKKLIAELRRRMAKGR